MFPCLPVKYIIGSYSLLWSLQSFVWSDIVSQAEVPVLDADMPVLKLASLYFIVYNTIATAFYAVSDIDKFAMFIELCISSSRERGGEKVRHQLFDIFSF